MWGGGIGGGTRGSSHQVGGWGLKNGATINLENATNMRRTYGFRMMNNDVEKSMKNISKIEEDYT